MADAHKAEYKITVLMTVYNEPVEFVEKAISSILTQKFKDFEYIIILDKHDNYEMRSYLEGTAKEDGRIRFYVNEQNMGLARSLDKGIDLAKGMYIARMCRLPRYLTKPRQRRSEWDMAGSDGISRVSAVFRGKLLLTNKIRII